MTAVPLCCTAALLVLLSAGCSPVRAPYDRATARGFSADHVWSLQVGAGGWPAVWTLCGRRNLLRLEVGPGGIDAKAMDYAGTTIWTERWPWSEPLRQGETIHVVLDKSILSVVRQHDVIASRALVDDVWEDSFWKIPEGSGHVLRQQKLGAVLFRDDFMHAPGETGEWALSGGWEIDATDNPVRSANAFRLVGARAPALATAGLWFWRNYRFAASVMLGGRDSLALYFYRLDDSNTYELRVRQEADGARLTLLRQRLGVATELAAQTIPRLLAWNRLEIAVVEGAVSVRMNDRMALECIDRQPLPFGGIGLGMAELAEQVVVDDVEVGPVQDFTLAPASGSVPPWACATRDAAGVTTLTAVSPVFQNATLCLDLKALSGIGPAGMQLLARVPAVGGGVGFDLRDATGGGFTLQVVETGPGQTPNRVRAECRLPAAPLDGEIRLHVRDREAWVELGGRVLCHGVELDAQPAPGMVRLIAPAAALEALPRLTVRQYDQMAALQGPRNSFPSEESMAVWSHPASEWQPVSGEPDVYLHRADLWADFHFGLLVSPADLDPADDLGVRDLRLYEGSDGEQAPLMTIGAESGHWYVEHAGKKTAVSRSVRGYLCVERRADLLTVLADGVPVYTATAGGNAFWRLGVTAKVPADRWYGRVVVRALLVKDYSFDAAPVDWLPTAGTWIVTNRWQCDPRWSFYSGRRLTGLAANWWRYRHGPNLTLEFFVGPKMNREHGEGYDYAADLNAVVAAPSRSIGDGYSFLFGGLGNSGSFIVHDQQILHANPEVRIPHDPGAVHRRWFYVKIRKYGDLLTWWVDGKLAGTAKAGADAGGGLALWTWKNEMMVARVRASSDLLVRDDAASGPSSELSYPCQRVTAAEGR